MKIADIIAIGNLAVNVIRLIVDLLKKDNKKDRS